MNKLNANAFGLALGILWSIATFLMVLMATYASYGTGFVVFLSDIYWGVEVSLKGALICLIWAFVDGFIGGYLLAWLYNRLS